jgi:hypothetical protein
LKRVATSSIVLLAGNICARIPDLSRASQLASCKFRLRRCAFILHKRTGNISTISATSSYSRSAVLCGVGFVMVKWESSKSTSQRSGNVSRVSGKFLCSRPVHRNDEETGHNVRDTGCVRPTVKCIRSDLGRSLIWCRDQLLLKRVMVKQVRECYPRRWRNRCVKKWVGLYEYNAA